MRPKGIKVIIDDDQKQRVAEIAERTYNKFVEVNFCADAEIMGLLGALLMGCGAKCKCEKKPDT